ncbi:hypothetical protein A1O3_10457 [Capronia epimyces CBS 606.96]|uniref:Phosphoribulokinase/uridine kinase domain-containing protein n=1 Tax=Capronia epimyces CBS 606.96 TaxID=1182542 RepID=W9Y4A5_9EURO|nr:uncharacterized protein A1O3_10457 [Capronia epimyces CBS 606.96]EXJ77299.1 hypothetical protein A1O3_10457 [Capronia epimyces CBS 606.96]
MFSSLSPPKARFDSSRSSSPQESKRIVVGIAGVPGSGKTTLASLTAARVNELYLESHRDEDPVAVAVPMDGFHYTREHLAGMANAAEAIHRRGAAFTFDAEGFRRLIESLTAPESKTVTAPSFDHATKDPVADAITIPPSTRIVLVEGNYCALDKPVWRDAAALLTERWFIDTPPSLAHQRLATRHLASGIVATAEEGWARATGPDDLNAQEIRACRLPCDEVLLIT